MKTKEQVLLEYKDRFYSQEKKYIDSVLEEIIKYSFFLIETNEEMFCGENDEKDYFIFFNSIGYFPAIHNGYFYVFLSEKDTLII